MTQSTQCAIAILPNYYGPDIQGNNAVNFLTTDDSNASMILYDTIDEAQDAIDELEDDTYYLSHGEAGRPEYVIVEDGVADYISDGRNGDMSNYRWDENDCKKNNGDCCGECPECIEMMIDQDRDYINNNRAA